MRVEDRKSRERKRDLYELRLEDCKNSDLYRKKNFLSETSKLRKTVLSKENPFIIFPATAILLRKTTKKKRRSYSTFIEIQYFNNKL